MLHKRNFLALIAVFSLLLIAPVQAGVLDGISGAFDDGSTVWTGSDIYDNGLAAPSKLFGTIDYAVMTAADFATAFPSPGVDPVTGSPYSPGDAFVYLYQINNTGTFSVSAEIVGVNSSANTIGQFENAAGEVASSLYGFDTGGKAIWNFASPLIPSGSSSYILAYSSFNKPTWGTAITVDGGTFGVSVVPTPGTDPIPEPASLALAFAGALAFVVRRRRL